MYRSVNQRCQFEEWLVENYNNPTEICLSSFIPNAPLPHQPYCTYSAVNMFQIFTDPFFSNHLK